MANLATDEKGTIEETASQQKKIEFIDPDDLITFVQEGEGEEAAAPERETEAEAEPVGAEHLELGSELKVSNDLYENRILEKREDTRARLAIIYTIATFGVFIIGVIIAAVDGISRNVSIIDNLKEVVPLLSGVFFGSLGFVLGYYFKSGEEK